MATIQDDIFMTVLKAKCTSAAWGSMFVKQEKAGDDITCCTKKLRLLNRWIEVLEGYYCQAFDYTSEDRYQCLTQEEAIELVGKVKVLAKL